MNQIINRQIQLASRPQGKPKTEDLKLVEEELNETAEGQVLIRNHFLSLDPYMRGRMNASKSYAKTVEVGEVRLEAPWERSWNHDTRISKQGTWWSSTEAGRSTP